MLFQVLKQLPKKTEHLEYTDMTEEQEKNYKELKVTLSQAVRGVGSDRKTSGIAALMKLRQMANHPLLSRTHYHDEKLTEMAHLMLQVSLLRKLN